MNTPRFPEVSCSQCGQSFGPGDHGFSHCSDHGGGSLWVGNAALMPTDVEDLDEMARHANALSEHYRAKVAELEVENARLRAALREIRHELWNDGDGGPRYTGYLAIIDAAIEPST